VSGFGKMRDGYADALIDLATADSRVVFVSADCGARERDFFLKEAKGRLIETGIAEANSAAIAAGLAAEGYKPYLLNFAYLLARMYNQLGQSIALDAYDVKIAGYYAGVWGIGGRSHNCVTDLSMMRALPNFSIFAPADAAEARTLVRRAHAVDGPTYTRLAGVATPNVFDAEPSFRPVRRLTDGPRATIFCHGAMVAEALKANATYGFDASVVNVSQIKPLPAEDLVAEARRTGRVVIVEEHSTIGGAGEAIATLLAQECGVPVRVLGIPDAFPWSVLMEEPDVYGKYGIGAADIARAVEQLNAGQRRSQASLHVARPQRGAA
jgi:transketolase